MSPTQEHPTNVIVSKAGFLADIEEGLLTVGKEIQTATPSWGSYIDKLKHTVGEHNIENIERLERLAEQEMHSMGEKLSPLLEVVLKACVSKTLKDKVNAVLLDAEESWSRYYQGQLATRNDFILSEEQRNVGGKRRNHSYTEDYLAALLSDLRNRQKEAFGQCQSILFIRWQGGLPMMFPHIVSTIAKQGGASGTVIDLLGGLGLPMMSNSSCKKILQNDDLARYLHDRLEPSLREARDPQNVNIFQIDNCVHQLFLYAPTQKERDWCRVEKGMNAMFASVPLGPLLLNSAAPPAVPYNSDIRKEVFKLFETPRQPLDLSSILVDVHGKRLVQEQSVGIKEWTPLPTFLAASASHEHTIAALSTLPRLLRSENRLTVTPGDPEFGNAMALFSELMPDFMKNIVHGYAPWHAMKHLNEFARNSPIIEIVVLIPFFRLLGVKPGLYNEIFKQIAAGVHANDYEV